jgi:hypothetical protein
VRTILAALIIALLSVLTPWEGFAAERARATQRRAAPEGPAATSGRGGFSCGGRKYCKDMASCEEAMFHLRSCGESRLDRDGDGRPCENVC